MEAGSLLSDYQRLDLFKIFSSKEQAFKCLALWHNGVEDCAMVSFRTVATTIESLESYYLEIFITSIIAVQMIRRIYLMQKQKPSEPQKRC